jgi:two-component system, chemotaxis family, chemotaxis protein CheY
MAKRILVVEDDAPIRDFMCAALADEGYEVVGAENGKTALELIRTCCPDLILLDMRMPIMDGEVFLELYQEMSFRRAPVVGLSASGRTEKIARELGVSDFLIKPVDLQLLLDCVKRHLYRSGVAV